MTDETRLVLLHGAGTGGWVWSRVIEALGRPALAPDLPSRTADLTPPACAREVVAGLDREGVSAVHLVLHSLAGVLGADLAAALGPRLRRITYIAAVIPPAGGSFAMARGFPTGLVLRGLFLAGRGRLKPTAGMIRTGYGNDLTAEDLAMLVERIGPDRPGMLLGRTAAPVAAVPSTYLRLTLDRSVKPAEQDRMMARLDRPRMVEVAAGHMAPLSRPHEVAAAIASG